MTRPSLTTPAAKSQDLDSESVTALGCAKLGQYIVRTSVCVVMEAALNDPDGGQTNPKDPSSQT
jgi:hypothetical protein